MTRDAVSATSPVPSAGADVLAVLVFVAIGRASHDEPLSILGFLGTAWPFLAGLALGWVALRAWRAPAVIRWTGVGVWAITVVAGLLLRVVSGEGAPTGFIVVTSLVLGFFLLGWRGVALVLARRARRSV
jgi:hypothetical protein